MYRRRGSSHQFLKLAEEAGYLGFWSLDLVSGEMLGSPGLARIIGSSQGGDPRGLLDTLIHPADRPVQGDLHNRLRNGRSFERTYRIIRKDRTLRWVKVRADIVLGTEDVPVRAEGVVFDVTEAEQARRQDEESRGRYEGLLCAIGAVVWTAAPEGRPRPDAAWQRLTGQTPEEMRDDGWLMAIDGRDRDAMACAWRRALAEGSPLRIEIGIVCPDGLTRRFDSHGIPLMDEDGIVRHRIGVLIPIAPHGRPSPLDAGADTDVDGVLVRAGRALLGWSMGELADRAQVSIASVKRLEDADQATARPKTRLAIRAALTHAGVVFDRDAAGVPRISLRHHAKLDRSSR